MIPEALHVVLRGGASDEALKDETAFFWVERNEDDDQIPALCDAVLKTNQLSSDWEGDDLFIVWRGKRFPVRITHTVMDSIASSWPVSVLDSMSPVSVGEMLSYPSRGNRHITLLALNGALQADYEIRYVSASAAEECPAFAPLPAADWAALEQQYGTDAVNAVFAPITESKNLFYS